MGEGAFNVSSTHGAYDCIAVYIVASGRNGAIYTGVTSDLFNRVIQHKQGKVAGFTAKYRCGRLVWYEQHHDIAEAIHREKLIKHWRRAWKLRLVEEANPDWRDLSDGWYVEDDGRLMIG